MKILENLKIAKGFKKMYTAYEFPFEKANVKINAMVKEARREYYRQAKELLENKAFKLELQDSIRKFYQDLAIKTTTPEEIAAYRLTLKFIQEFENRFIYLAGLYRQEDDAPVNLP